MGSPEKRPFVPRPPEMDRAHVPMTEEFDRAKWTLPPISIVMIGIAIIGVLVFVFGYSTRAKPVMSGSIGDVVPVQLQDNTVLVAIELNVANTTDKSWYIQKIEATAKTDKGENTDTAATAADSDRYFQAFPTLRTTESPVLKFDQKISPGQRLNGTIVVSFPITKDEFDARKSLTVTIQPFDNKPVTLTK
jgi:Domain of unknown function (DUF4352)